MTLDEARKLVPYGRVIYRPAHGPARAALEEHGAVTAVNDEFVFVRYDGDDIAKATHARDLVLEEELPDER